MDSFMEQVVARLKTLDRAAYQATNGIIMLLDDEDVVWYGVSTPSQLFTLDTLQAAKEELLLG